MNENEKRQVEQIGQMIAQMDPKSKREFEAFCEGLTLGASLGQKPVEKSA